MHSWEVVGIDRRDDSEADDCSSIESIGYLVAGKLRQKPVASIHGMLEQGHAQYHVTVDGDRYELEAVRSDAGPYVRTLDTDSAEDPLLQLPTIEEYLQADEMAKRFER